MNASESDQVKPPAADNGGGPPPARLLASQYEQELAALASARKQLEIANNRYRSGLVTYLQVATAQNAALERERVLARLRGQRFAAAVALVKSLGGGSEPSAR